MQIKSPFLPVALPLVEQMMVLIVITPDTGELALVFAKNSGELPTVEKVNLMYRIRISQKLHGRIMITVECPARTVQKALFSRSCTLDTKSKQSTYKFCSLH